MKLFIIRTKSESGDDYFYIVNHDKTPTRDEVELFLSLNACDKDDMTCYESIIEIAEINPTKAKAIPTKGKRLEFL
ncbi:MAG: hypothetical protein KAR42_16185 [candidate division Zixibacteria bacterium]|nr:hypothetical protein [candidate division Zixibacteria bacterium]